MPRLEDLALKGLATAHDIADPLVRFTRDTDGDELAGAIEAVAETAGEAVGFIAGHLTRRFGCEGEVQWLLVAPAERGGPAAAALLGAMAAWFGAQDAARVW